MNGIRSLLGAGSSSGVLSDLGADPDNYEDCRIELRSHNLVELLMHISIPTSFPSLFVHTSTANAPDVGTSESTGINAGKSYG